jgi:prepilin-type N-terminal cleavage/methylation domain-containing protein
MTRRDVPTFFQRGFTIVEMLVYMGLLSLLMLIFSNIFVAILDTQLSSESTGSVAQDGRYIYSRLIYDINRAESVSLPAQIGDMSNTLEMRINGIDYEYGMLNGDLMIADATDSAQLNSYDTRVAGLLFKRIGNVNGKHTFQINFTVSSKTNHYGVVESKSFQTTAGLR